ncbi:hypothetical protein C0Q70_14660 [Pomacea canaliculata]|uniref:Uncharacterized protein n=1 Tax=Pomacea canaliculata TaxID=400727 RepID=A0A2T7NSP1_POMCA|nr:hypothetical protein C0Q70_14660 [Pomacea canaliculata]
MAVQKNALEKAMKCTAGLGIGPPFISNAFIERGQIQFAKDACRDRTLHDAISCLEKILEACQGNSDREHFLQNMIDTKKSRDVVDFFCSNIHVYESHAPCIASRHSALTQCLESQQKTMQTKVKATSNMDFLMTSNCKYFQAADVCSRRVLGENCGQEALGMVVRVFSGFKPPICDVSSGGDSQPDYEGQQSGKRPLLHGYIYAYIDSKTTLNDSSLVSF